MQGLFHGIVLLDNGSRNGFGSIFSRCRLHGDSGQGGRLGFAVVFGAVQVEQVQPQGIAHNTEAGKAHGRSPEHGVQGQAEGDEHTGSQRDADDVVDERPEQVFVDVAQGGAAQPDGGGHIGEPGVHQDHIGRVNGNIGTGADGDAGVRAGQGGGIVDAVAHHGHLAALLQPADHGLFAVGQNACNDLVHTRLPANGIGSALVVTGQHDHPDAHVLQLPDGTGAVLLEGVRHSDHAHQAACTAKEEGRFALSGQPGGFGLEFGGYGCLGGDELRIAAVDLHAVQPCGKAIAGQGGKIGHIGAGDGLSLGIGQHRLGQRVLALLLQRGRQRQQLALGNALHGQDVSDPGFAAGDGAGLVQRHDLGAACSFQRGGSFEQDAVPGPQTVAHHDGHRRCQTQRTGAADDQHRDAPGQRIAELPAQQQPDKGGQHRNGDDRGHKKAGNGIGDLGNGGLGGGGIADHPDDLGQRGILAHTGGFALQETGLVGGGGADLVSRSLVHRDALAGQGTLVHGAGTFQHKAVHRDVLTGAHHKEVALFHLCNGHSHFGPFPQQGGGLGGQLHQALERVGGLALGAGLQHLAHGDQGQDHGGRFKVELHHVVHDERVVAVYLGAGYGEQGVGAPEKAGRRTQRHQCIHVGGTVEQALEAADEELLVDDHHDARQQQLDQTHGNVVAVEPVGERPAPHHVAHRKIHQHRQKDQ